MMKYKIDSNVVISKKMWALVSVASLVNTPNSPEFWRRTSSNPQYVEVHLNSLGKAALGGDIMLSDEQPFVSEEMSKVWAPVQITLSGKIDMASIDPEYARARCGYCWNIFKADELKECVLRQYPGSKDWNCGTKDLCPACRKYLVGLFKYVEDETIATTVKTYKEFKEKYMPDATAKEARHAWSIIGGV